MVIIMNSNELEKAFSDFLDGDTCDKAEEGLFDLTRAAFVAGWSAAKRDNIKIIKD